MEAVAKNCFDPTPTAQRREYRAVQELAIRLLGRKLSEEELNELP